MSDEEVWIGQSLSNFIHALRRRRDAERCIHSLSILRRGDGREIHRPQLHSEFGEGGTNRFFEGIG